MHDRDERITRERNLGIELDPEILRVFRNSTSVSSKEKIIFCSPIFVQLRRVERVTSWNHLQRDEGVKRRSNRTKPEKRRKSKKFRLSYWPGTTWRPSWKNKFLITNNSEKSTQLLDKWLKMASLSKLATSRSKQLSIQVRENRSKARGRLCKKRRSIQT